MTQSSPLPIQDIERYQAATALLGGVVTEAQLRRALASASGQAEHSILHILIRQGALLPQQKSAFDQSLKALLRTSKGNVDDIFRQVLETTLSSVFEQVRDPAIRHYFQTGRHILGSRLASETLARYMLTRVHAQGGIGEVWLGHDLTLDRNVAIKRIREDVDRADSTRKRFLREGKLTGRLQHPNIPPVYVVGGDAPGEEPFYAMRFINGQTLSLLITNAHKQSDNGRLPLPALNRMLNIFLNVCDAVSYAHSRGVLHRDLKPPNVVVGDFGEVFLVDWGVAKSFGQTDETSVFSARRSMSEINKIDWETRTRVGDIVGTPAFMSPEQAAGKVNEVDHRTDVYGLGSILFCILTSEAPHQRFPEEGPDSALDRIATHAAPVARSLNPSCSSSLSAVCAKAMARERQDRYQSARDLANDVRRWLSNEPTKAFREPRTQRFARWILRNESTFRIGTALLVAVLMIATTFIGYGWAVSFGIEKNSIREFSDELNNISLSLQADAAILANQTRLLSQFPEITSFLKAVKEDNSEVKRKTNATLTERISSFLSRQQGRMAFSLVMLEPKPKIVFRVEQRDGKGESFRTDFNSDLDPEELQSLCDEAVTVPDGSIYASPAHIYRLGGRLVNAMDPFVHLAAPIRLEKSDKPVGVAILHTSFSQSFPSLLGSAADRFRFNSNFYLTDEEGRILGMYVAYVPPGTILNTEYDNIVDLLAGVTELFHNASRSTYSSLQTLDGPNHSSIVYARKELIDSWQPPRRFTLFLAMSKSKALNTGEHWLHITLVATFLILAAAIGCVALLRHTLYRVAGRVH